MKNKGKVHEEKEPVKMEIGCFVIQKMDNGKIMIYDKSSEDGSIFLEKGLELAIRHFFTENF